MKLINGDQHPSVKPGICGVTTFGGSGIEWICIKKPHAKIYQRRSRKRGEPIFNNNPSADRHLFVNRWPNRKVRSDDDKNIEG